MWHAKATAKAQAEEKTYQIGFAALATCNQATLTVPRQNPETESQAQSYLRFKFNERNPIMCLGAKPEEKDSRMDHATENCLKALTRRRLCFFQRGGRAARLRPLGGMPGKAARSGVLE